MIKLLEAHVLRGPVEQKYILWVQIGVNNIFGMEDLQQVYDSDGNVNCLKFGEQGPLAGVYIFSQTAGSGV